jgi:hypothetical protein
MTTGTAVIVRPRVSLAPPDDVIEAEIVDEDESAGERTHDRLELHGRTATRLESFIKSRGIKPAHLARESGYSRQHLLRLRLGRMDPTRRCIIALVAALRRLSRENVQAHHVFELSPAETAFLIRYAESPRS